MLTLQVTKNRGAAPRRTRRRPVLALAGLGLVTALAAASPASAEPVLVVTPAVGLDPAGAFVVVSGSGFEPDAQLFVMQCRASSGDDHTCNSVGLRKVTTDATGSFTANAMRLVGRFGATDCTVDACAVMTSAVSDHAGDRSQDRSAPVQFAAPVATTQAPPPETAPPAPPVTEPGPPASSAVPDPAPTTTAASGPPVDDGPTASSTTSTTSVAPAADASGQDDAGGGGADADARALAAATVQGPGDDAGGTGVLAIVGAGAAVAAVAAAGVVGVRRRRVV